MEELYEESEQLGIRAREIRDKYKKLNFLDYGSKKEVEERDREWQEWQEEFEANYHSIQRAEEDLRLLS